MGTDVFTIHHILYNLHVLQANPYNTTQNQIRNSVLTTFTFFFFKYHKFRPSTILEVAPVKKKYIGISIEAISGYIAWGSRASRHTLRTMYNYNMSNAHIHTYGYE